MSRPTKWLLVSGIVTLIAGSAIATGIINADALPALHVLFPTGVILLGLTLIARLLEKETARYDDEHARHPASRSAQPASPPSAASSEKSGRAQNESGVRKPRHA